MINDLGHKDLVAVANNVGVYLMILTFCLLAWYGVYEVIAAIW